MVQWFLMRIFKVFYIDVGKKAPHSGVHVFLKNHDSLNNLGRGSPKKHFCQIILKSVQRFLTRRFFKFSI